MPDLQVWMATALKTSQIFFPNVSSGREPSMCLKLSCEALAQRHGVNRGNSRFEDPATRGFLVHASSIAVSTHVYRVYLSLGHEVTALMKLIGQHGVKSTTAEDIIRRTVSECHVTGLVWAPDCAVTAPRE